MGQGFPARCPGRAPGARTAVGGRTGYAGRAGPARVSAWGASQSGCGSSGPPPGTSLYDLPAVGGRFRVTTPELGLAPTFALRIFDPELMITPQYPVRPAFFRTIELRPRAAMLAESTLVDRLSARV